MRVPREEREDRLARLSGGRARMARELWWLALTVAFALFVATGRVSTFRGVEGRGNSRVWDVWRQLAGSLPEVSSPALIRAAYVVMMFVFLAGCLVALWLSLAVDGTDESNAGAADRRGARRPRVPPIEPSDTP